MTEQGGTAVSGPTEPLRNYGKMLEDAAKEGRSLWAKAYRGDDLNVSINSLVDEAAAFYASEYPGSHFYRGAIQPPKDGVEDWQQVCYCRLELDGKVVAELYVTVKPGNAPTAAPTPVIGWDIGYSFRYYPNQEP